MGRCKESATGVQLDIGVELGRNGKGHLVGLLDLRTPAYHFLDVELRPSQRSMNQGGGEWGHTCKNLLKGDRATRILPEKAVCA